MPGTNIRELLMAVAEGDGISFQELFHLYKQQVYAYAMHFTRSVAASEEIVQDIFVKLWVHKSGLRKMDRFEAYLYTITRNLCFDYLKKMARERAMKQEWSWSAEMSEESTESAVICNSYEALIHQALEQLPPQQKKIYTLNLYQGQKHEEIAECLHISRNTVKVHLAKARAAVRSYLATHLDAIILLLAAVFLGRRF